MSDIRPIPTTYDGYRFRSRLEARWAVFFNALGVHYQYEEEGYSLGNGLYYLPDFHVHCCGTRGCCKPEESFDLWIEVKGRMSAEDAEKIIRFSGSEDWVPFAETLTHPILVVDSIPSPYRYPDSDECGSYRSMNTDKKILPFNYLTVDGDNFAAYPAADKYGNFYLWGDDCNYIRKEDILRVQKALEKARQARFEFGETPEGRGTSV